MIHNQIRFLPLESIVIRPDRQRTENRDESGFLTPLSVYELALSIGRNQWISTLLVEKDTNVLIAGERRATAIKVLARALSGDFSGLKDPNQIAALQSVCDCRVDSFKNWTHVPCQLGANLTPLELSTFEWAENFHRLDLSWQDKAKAAWEIHIAHAEAVKPERWTTKQTAEILSTDEVTASLLIKAWREVERGDERTKEAVLGSHTPLAAKNAVSRIKERRGDIGTRPLRLTANGEVVTPKKEVEPTLRELSKEATPAESTLLLADFKDFAAQYAGPRFNLLHCDFPFGINYNSGPGFTTAADTKASGDYDDSPEVYWELLRTLAAFKENLIADSAHILFWFSQNNRRETEDFFESYFPEAVIQKFMMVWHTSDNSGIVPDPQRYGRRTYETALSISIGDRKVVKPVALSFSAPRTSSEKFHRSMKPTAVLEHFLSMYVDDSTIMLDPTAGSGSALVVAKGLGAAHVLGLERDAEMHAQASKFINEKLT